MTATRTSAPAKPSARRNVTTTPRNTSAAAAAKQRASTAARRQTLAATCKKADETLLVDDADEVGVALAKRAVARVKAAEAEAEAEAELEPAAAAKPVAKKTARKTGAKKTPAARKKIAKTAAKPAAETPADEDIADATLPAPARKSRGPSGVSRTAVDRLDDPKPASGLKLLDRVSRSIEREINQIEALVGGSHLKEKQRTEAERRARTLASLTKTLSELRRLRATEQARAADDDAVPRDLDEFRRALSRRLEQLVAVAAEFPAAGHE
ncbi:MAG TPA: hypothetical protein VGC77_06795 [Rhodopseudomonas sp.]|uniref:hypothetical protein n=1 Tax=Rhodopseudomonas sp. TaxID=1078 RepID=UPI002ED96452